VILPLPLVAILLGIVEGITEFLPISSTGHLILAERLCGFARENGSRAEVFAIFIQFGAVLAVVVEYRAKLIAAARGFFGSRTERSFAVNVAIAFLPAVFVGLLTHHWITEHLFRPEFIAGALVTGAIAIVVIERLKPVATIGSADAVGPARALLIGVAQCAGLWPGFSRSAATILGGLLCGLERKAATEFSFFLAIPTLGAATVYDLWKKHGALDPGDALWLLVATVVSFLVAWASIRWLLRFVATHDLTPFAWYRIALGIAVWLGMK
jgi:undecaprenyl-diphosphatase